MNLVITYNHKPTLTLACYLLLKVRNWYLDKLHMRIRDMTLTSQQCLKQATNLAIGPQPLKDFNKQCEWKKVKEIPNCLKSPQIVR